MSVLIGPLSGALVAGGLGLLWIFKPDAHKVSSPFTPNTPHSNLPNRTEQHRKDLHALSVRLVETPSVIQAPPPAAARIHKDLLVTEIQSRWNHEVAVLFRGFQNLDKSALEWGRSLLYGPPATNNKSTQTTNTPPAPASTSTSAPAAPAS